MDMSTSAAVTLSVYPFHSALFSSRALPGAILYLFLAAMPVKFILPRLPYLGFLLILNAQ
jgi:hypothetical protein